MMTTNLIIFFCVFLVLVVTPTLAANDENNNNTQRRYLRALSSSSSSINNNRSPEARQALSNAILSSVRSDTGKVDEKALEEAVEFGFGRQQVRHMSRLAVNQVRVDGGSMERIEKDMERFTSPDYVFPSTDEEEEEKDDDGNTIVYDYTYVPKGAWHMSTETHVLISKAVLTAIRSPTHEVDPKAMEDVLEAGLSREDILKYVNVAITPSKIASKIA